MRLAYVPVASTTYAPCAPYAPSSSRLVATAPAQTAARAAMTVATMYATAATSS